MKQNEIQYNVRVNYRSREEQERRFAVSKKVADIIKLETSGIHTKV
jgi:hypothetical protein